MKHKKLLNTFLCAAILFVSLPYCAAAQDADFDYVPGEIIITTTENICDSSEKNNASNQNEYTLIDFDKYEISLSDEDKAYTDENNNYTYNNGYQYGFFFIFFKYDFILCHMKTPLELSYHIK